MVRSWYHLARRFFGFISARPLSPREQSEVAALLPAEESALFFAQEMPDQRHALVVSRRVLRERPGDRSAARAALLHDVGKIGIRMGAVQRSVATVCDGLRIPLSGNYLQYRNHAVHGGDMLDRIGAPPLIVAFARLHPGEPPPGAGQEQWSVLLAADHG